jgi:hypothetical protein
MAVVKAGPLVGAISSARSGVLICFMKSLSWFSSLVRQIDPSVDRILLIGAFANSHRSALCRTVMHRFAILALGLLCLASCGKQSMTDLEVRKIIAAGGPYWSNMEKAPSNFGAGEITGGGRFWLWPAFESKPVIKNGDLKLVFKWFLRPGQRPPGPHGTDQVLIVVSPAPGSVLVSNAFNSPGFAGRGSAAELAPGAKEGEVELKLDLREEQLTGDGWLHVYLLPFGAATTSDVNTVQKALPSSNLLKINVTFDAGLP